MVSGEGEGDAMRDRKDVPPSPTWPSLALPSLLSVEETKEENEEEKAAAAVLLLVVVVVVVLVVVLVLVLVLVPSVLSCTEPEPGVAETRCGTGRTGFSPFSPFTLTSERRSEENSTATAVLAVLSLWVASSSQSLSAPKDTADGSSCTT